MLLMKLIRLAVVSTTVSLTIFGSAMAQSARDRRIVTGADAQERIMSDLAVSTRLTKSRRAKVNPIMERSLRAIKQKNAKRIQSTIAEARTLGWGPFSDCGDHCQHLLDAGNAPGYGVCYWACVARGGPGASAPPASELAPQ